MASRPRVAIVLVNYNGRDLLQRYLPSVLDLDYENERVIVVDNDSDDDSVPFLERNFPEVDVIALDENVGFSRGNNVGADAAPEADYLWFLNTDVEVEPTSLGRLVERIDSEPDTGMVVPRIDHMSDRGTIQSLGFDCDVATISSPLDNGERTPTDPDPHPVSYGVGAALLVDRDVWEEIGGFDPEHFFYGDDIYLGMRGWMLGYRVEAVPGAVVYHEGHGTQGHATPRISYHYSRSHVRTFLRLVERRNLLRGAPRLLQHLLYHALADAFYHRSPKAGLYRLLGLLAPLVELPALLRERSAIQRDREYPDEAFAECRTFWSEHGESNQRRPGDPPERDA